MNHLSYRRALAALALLSLSACATTNLEERLDQKIARQDSIQTPRDLDTKAAQMLAATPGLTGPQKQSLATLKSATGAKLKANSRESLKLRALLVEDLLSPNDHLAEIDAVKKRMRQLADERIETIFRAVNQANDLIGRSGLIREAMDLQMIQDETEN